MKKTAVVILNWNGRELLEKFLPSVVSFTTRQDIEIVVADNYSTDDSVDFLQRTYPGITRILLDKNYGFAEGYNRALAQVDADYFVLLNSDVEVTSEWLYPLIHHLNNNTEVAAIQPKILSQRNKDKFEYAGAAGGFIDRYGYPFCRGRIFGVLEDDNGQYNIPSDVFWTSGACMIIRAEDYFGCGGLDSSFFAHMEEIDLCWRLNARGRKLICLPSSIVYHVGGATLNEESPRKTFLNFRNNLLMLYKNLPDEHLDKVLKVRFVLDYLAAVHLVLKGKISNAKAVLSAYKEFRKIKDSYSQVREENLAKAVNKTIPAIYNKSILKGFYFKGRKLFSDLVFS